MTPQQPERMLNPILAPSDPSGSWPGKAPDSLDGHTHCELVDSRGSGRPPRGNGNPPGPGHNLDDDDTDDDDEPLISLPTLHCVLC